MAMAKRKREAEAKVSLPASPPALKRRRSADADEKADVEGFGCPRMEWPHHVQVVIPEIRGGEVQIIEDFGVGGHASGRKDQIIRCTLPRARWNAMADVARREFNERLRALGLPLGTWKPGVTKVERVLGQELVLLGYVCGAAETADIAAVASNWATLRPEERWWLVGWLTSHHSPRVLQGAALMLSGGPAEAIPHSEAPRKVLPTLPLFSFPSRVKD